MHGETTSLIVKLNSEEQMLTNAVKSNVEKNTTPKEVCLSTYRANRIVYDSKVHQTSYGRFFYADIHDQSHKIPAYRALISCP